ncbi:MAG: glycosyltransferase family 4 protein [Anaerolineae bacterium]|nr:glycosyltransferase family 4 protein [Anaerolineae bacterium]
MRIAIDASRCTVKRVTGTEQYAIQLIRALIRRDHPHQITLYFRDEPAPDLFPQSLQVAYQVIPFRRAWTHLRFAVELWCDRPDVTFVPAHTLPILFPGRAVVTVHDLGYRWFPQAHSRAQRLYLDWTTRFSARRGSIVLADSQATAADLNRFYRTPLQDIRVVYPGVDAPPVGGIEAARHKYGLERPYFLFIGTLQPRKNIARLVEAYRLWRGQHPEQRIDLVLAGKPGWLYDPAWVEGVDGVRLIGYIDEADKGALYAGALALVFPSLHEGFGFPVLEAMHSGTPVIASRTSSLPELVGEAGLLVDPLDVGSISAAMSQMSEDAALRARLVEMGYAQAQRFTWERAAEQVIAALEAVVQG